MTDTKEELEQLEQLEKEKEAARKAVVDDAQYNPEDDDKTWEPGC